MTATRSHCIRHAVSTAVSLSSLRIDGFARFTTEQAHIVIGASGETPP
jgi:hypothetical protein